MARGCVFWFCSEWQRARRVLVADQDALAELRSCIGSGGALGPGSAWVQQHGLEGWLCDEEDAAEAGLCPEGLAGGRCQGGESGPRSRGLPRGPSSPLLVGAMFRQLRTEAPVSRAPSPQRPLWRAAGRPAPSPRPRTPAEAPRPCGVPLLFTNPSHCFGGGLSELLTKGEFVEEVRRLRAPPLFPGPTEAVLSVEEAELLFDALLTAQAPEGEALLHSGREMDLLVERLHALERVRQLVERSAPSLRAFFGSLDLDDSRALEASELRHFVEAITTVSDRSTGAVGVLNVAGLDLARLAELLLAILDTNGDGRVHLWEIRRQLAVVAPSGMSLVELAGHFELKYGYGSTGGCELMSCRQWFNRLCHEESLDCPLEDAMWSFHAWRGGAPMMQPSVLQVALKRMPFDASWGMEDDVVDSFFCALGVRSLMLARAVRMDACLPLEATTAGVALDPEGVPLEVDVRGRFDRLWSKCVPAEGQWEKGGGPAEGQLRERCYGRFCSAVREESGERSSPGPRSLFPNINGVLAIASTCLWAGQTFVVRYRLVGAANFVHPEYVVRQDGKDPVRWPVPREALGDTPFIGLVPRGLRWTHAGGGGFYLGREPFSKVDLGLRAELPLDSVGRPQMYGSVELSAPSLRAQREPLTEYELRLFCARRRRIIGSIGSPLQVRVERRLLPPPLETLQVRLSGRTAALRWAPLGLGAFAAEPPRRAQLLLRSLGKVPLQRELSLEAEVTEWELRDLQPDTEHEFRLRLRGLCGPGREAVVTCRTNGRCSEPKTLRVLSEGTTGVELSWEPPEQLGNETTRDRARSPEAIVRYEGTLRVGGRESGALDSDPADEAAGAELSGRTCWWSAGSWRQGGGRSVVASLGGLRPDVRYVLQGFCAVSSMGPGQAARPLAFHTLPLTPRVGEVRIRQERVVISISMLGAARMELEVTVALKSKPGEVKSFTVRPSASRQVTEAATTELQIPFTQLAVAESSDSHVVKLRAKNEGGWSDWSAAHETIAIARQQGAEAAQARLLRAIRACEIEELEKVLAEVQDIEFNDDRPIASARQLLETLVSARDEVREAERLRHPERLASAIRRAEEVGLPDLEEVRRLLETLRAVRERLDTARGIFELREALRAGYEAELPKEILQVAAARLGAREAAQLGLAHAVEVARAPVLEEALEQVCGMHIPEEEPARRLLASFRSSEALMRSALETRLIADLAASLESATACGLREEELFAAVFEMRRELEAERARASEELEDAMEARFPERLSLAIQWANGSQVPQERLEAGRELLQRLNRLLDGLAAAVGVEDRAAALEAAQGEVPAPLRARAELQLECLREVLQARSDGDLPAMRRALKRAEVAGVKARELLEAGALFQRWAALHREVEVAASLTRTARLRSAMDAALSAGLSPSLLVWAEHTLESLALRDLARERLSRAVEACSDLSKSLRHACDCNVQDPPLLAKGRFLLRRLKATRRLVAEALEGRELSRLHAAVEEARRDPPMPEEELEAASALLEALRGGELAEFARRLEQAREERDFRALDALTARGRLLRASGVEVGAEVLAEADALARRCQADEQREMEAELHQTRFLGHDAALAGDDRSLPVKIPPEHDIESLPFEVALGEVRLTYRPFGGELFVLPREIVQGRVSVVVADAGEGNDASAAIAEAESAGDTMLQLVRECLLSPVDTIRRMDDHVVRHDGANHRVDLDVSFYLRAERSALELVEAIYEDNALSLNTEMRASVLAAEAPGPEGGRGLGEGASCGSDCATRALAASVAKELSERASRRATTLAGLVGASMAAKLPGAECFKQLHARVLRKVTVEMLWDYPAGLVDVLDPSLFLFDDEGLVEIISHNSKKVLFASADQRYNTTAVEGELEGVVRHLAEQESTSRNGRRVLQIRLDIIPERIHDLAVVLSAHNSRDLSKFQNLRLRFLDTNSDAELATYAMGNGGRAESVVCCTLNLLSDSLWHIHGSSVQCRGTLRDFRPVLEKLLVVGLPRNVSMRNKVPVILEAMKRKLELPRSLKCASTAVGPANLLRLDFVHELHEGEAEPGDAERLAASFAERAVVEEVSQAVLNTGDERFRPRHFTISAGASRAFTRLQVDFHWGYPEPEDIRDAGEDRECRFLDAACVVFSGRALAEVVDYRGPHGVRLVHNGIYDESGVWLGHFPVGDATNAAVRYVGETFDDLEKLGRQTFEINLPCLPPGVTDIFFVISTPVFQDVGIYKDIKVVFRDGENQGHEVLVVQMPTTGLSQEAGVLCRATRMEGSYWRIGAFRTSSPGSAPDYRPLLSCLRNIQERTHGRASVWEHKVQRLAALQKNTRVMTPLGNWRKSAARRKSSLAGQG